LGYFGGGAKNEPCFERCLLRRRENNNKRRLFCMSARQAIHRTGLFFYFQPNTCFFRFDRVSFHEKFTIFLLFFMKGSIDDKNA